MKFYVDNYLDELLKKWRENIKEYTRKARKLARTIQKELEDISYRTQRKIRISIAKARDALRKKRKQLPDIWEEAFQPDTAKKAAQMAQVYGEEMAAAFYDTQLRLQGLEDAFIRAAAPIAYAFVPIVNRAVGAMTALFNTMGKVISAFLESTFGIKAYEKSVKSALSATTSMERQLAGFDQIERLGSAGSGLTSALVPDSSQVIPGWEKLVEKLEKITAPLKKIDFSPAWESAQKAMEAFEPVLDAVVDALFWAMENLLVPLAQWAAENVLPALLDTLTETLQVLGTVIEDVRPVLSWLWETFLKGLAQWYGDKLIADIGNLGENFRQMGQNIHQYMPTVNAIMEKLQQLMGIGQTLRTDADAWKLIMANLLPLMDSITSATAILPGPLGALLSLLMAIIPALGDISGGFTDMGENAKGVLQGLMDMVGGLWDFTDEKVVGPTQSGTKTFLNKIVTFFETTIKGISSAYNKMFAGIGANLEKVETVSPTIGAAARAVQFANIPMPSIPRLARGAVLPANKPFMAVVGDQKHGTNVETPLATIQEALDVTLSDRMEGMMAGFNAVTDRQERILEAILGLDVSDGALHGAVKRYERKMALATGGV